MNSTTIRAKSVFIAVTSMLGIFLAVVAIQAAKAQAGTQSWRQSNISGFGNLQNTHVSALANFSGQMYAGTWKANGAQVWRTSDGLTWTQFATTWSTSNTRVINDVETFGSYLYVGTQGNEGEIWRTAGVTWEQVASGGLGDSNNDGFDALAVYSNTLIAATANISTGVEIWSSPTGNVGSWQQANSDGFGFGGTSQNIIMDTYNNYLYIGFSRESNQIAELWRTNDQVTWTPVFTDGLGNPDNSSVSAMAGFNGYFYIGLRNLTEGGEVWRSTNGTNWTSVFTGGLGNANNTRPYGLIVFDNCLYLVMSNLVTGAEVWRTEDGLSWQRMSDGGWGDSNNGYAGYSDKAANIYNGSLYIGTYNSVTGGQIWQRLHQLYLPLVVK